MSGRKKLKKVISSTAQQWTSAYERLYPNYDHYTQRLHELLNHLLKAHEIPFHTIEARTKSVGSFLEKLQRPGKNYIDPLSELRDLSGLRIVLFYTDDVKRVAAIIDKEFKVDTENSIDKLDALAIDQFGYLSIHKVVQLSSSRAKMTEWQTYDKLFAEVQIRTVLQHAWASISHRLQYKRESEIPAPVRRKLTRLAGLLELTDEEFSEIQTEIQTRKEDVSSRIDAKDAALSLDLDSITTYLSNDPLPKIVSKAAQSSGLEITEPDSDGAAQLLKTCELIKISKIGELTLVLFRLQSHLALFFKTFKTKRFNSVGGDVGHWTAVCLVGYDAGKTIKPTDLPWDLDYTRSVFRAGAKTFSKI